MTSARRSRRTLTAASLCGMLCATGVVWMVRGGGTADARTAVSIAPPGQPGIGAPGPIGQIAPMAAVTAMAPMPPGAPFPGGDAGQTRRDPGPLFEVADGHKALPDYAVTPLAEGLAPGVTFEPRALNDRGEVAGTLIEPRGDGERLRRQAVVYRNGRFHHIEPVGDFGRLSLTDINDRGESAGTLVRYRRGTPPVVHVAKVSAGGVVTDLGTFGEPSYTDSVGRLRAAPVHEFGPRIDSAGRVVARVGDTLLRWTPGKTVQRLGAGYVVDVSDAGHVAGATGVDDGSATIWTHDGRTPVRASRGVPQELHELNPGGSPMPDRSVVECVNDRKQAVIAVEVGGNGFSGRRLTLYYLFEGGKRSRLALMRGPQSGTRINNRGDVVGFSNRSADGRMVPYLYRKGKMYDLQKAVLRSSGWTIDAVTALNDRGQMIAFGRRDDGTFRPLLVTPVDKPVSAAATKRRAAPAPRQASSAGGSRARG